MVVTAPHIKAAITCGAVTENLAPCLQYLETGQGPTFACCEGIKTLNSMAVTTDDRRTVCRCMKAAAAAFPGLNPAFTAALPGKCGVSIPGNVGSQTDCSKYCFPKPL